MLDGLLLAAQRLEEQANEIDNALALHTYLPRGAAKQLLECDDPEVLMSGPAGTGKSRACLEKLHEMCIRNPGMRGLIVRKTQVSMTSTALVTYREHVAQEAIEREIVHWYGGSAQEAACYRYSNGSRINVGGMDKPTKIMSSEYDVVYVQEAIELTATDWEAITTRLRNGKTPVQQLIADTNPDTETHWLKQRCNSGATTMIDCKHSDNPVLVDDDGRPTPRGAAYLAKLDALTGVRKLRLKDGLWVSAEGTIFEDFDRSTHLIGFDEPIGRRLFPDRKIPDPWTRWWAIDFGFVHPFVWQCWAEDPEGRLYLYRQHVRTGLLVEDHAKIMLDAVRPGGVWQEPRPRAIVCDHDAEGRATLEKHLGMSTSAANKSVLDGIDAFASRLRPAAHDGLPRLFIIRDSLMKRDQALVDSAAPTCLEEEIPGYVWDTGAGKRKGEQPLKEQDDSCDTGRYVVAERDLGGRPRIRTLGGGRRR